MSGVRCYKGQQETNAVKGVKHGTNGTIITILAPSIITDRQCDIYRTASLCFSELKTLSSFPFMFQWKEGSQRPTPDTRNITGIIRNHGGVTRDTPRHAGLTDRTESTTRASERPCPKSRVTRTRACKPEHQNQNRNEHQIHHPSVEFSQFCSISK